MLQRLQVPDMQHQILSADHQSQTSLRSLGIIPIFCSAIAMVISGNFLLSAPLAAAAELFTEKPVVSQKAGSTTIQLTLAEETDLEIAIVNSHGQVVRHLAAGAVGSKAPPPAPLKRGLTQTIVWNGLNDDGLPAKGGPFQVRIRTGMGVKVDAAAGGDPYAWWTEDSGQGDHAQFRLTGLDAKADGSVYLFGNITPYGLPALRRYDARGNFVRTVFPPPADHQATSVEGWGINKRSDGTWTLQANYSWGGHTSEWTLMTGTKGNIWSGRLVPTPEPDKLCLVSLPLGGNRMMYFGTDGKLPQWNPQPALGGEPLPEKGLIRSFFTALSPDGKHLYISGMSTLQDGFWREGQVWQVDLATRQTRIYYSLGDDERKNRTAIGHSAACPYSAFQGVAVDRDGRVFVCDRMNKRVLVLDPKGKVISELPVENPDAIAVSPTSKAVYVTTRFGNYSGNGKLELLKFTDWTKKAPATVHVLLRNGIGKRQESSLLTVVEDKGETLVWVGYTQLPVRIYRDRGEKLELVKNFYEAGPQRALDLQHMTLDPKTGDLYIADSQGFLSRMRDWKKPLFEPCMLDAKTRLNASTIAIDTRSRHLYSRNHYRDPVHRWNLDGEYLTPAPIEGSNNIIPPVTCAWVFTGLWERGMAACPAGLATLGVVVDGTGGRWDNYQGPITYFRAHGAKTPWPAQPFTGIGGQRPNTGGIAFDRQGNLYVGIVDIKPTNVLPGFEKDKDYQAKIGRIHKFSATGSMASGNLFPTVPAKASTVYDIQYGPLMHYPRFTVDDFGRIYYPNGLLPQVGIIDNEGNRILSFGTWGNRDSLAGLPGDLVPTKDVPMAWPNSVAADDNYIYVSDILNARLLRLAKTFSSTQLIPLK
ncbi:MAG: SMP-30/gluconolactonase/LRE family protein [Zavarzinella sp.]